MKILPVLFILTLMPAICFAQSSYQYGIIPSVNLQKNFPKQWKSVFKVESRQSLYKHTLKYDYLLTDISLVVTKRIATNITVGGGYLLRAENDYFYSRAIQQISFGKNYSVLRMAHRIMTDQTFEGEGNTEFRLRYRLSTEIPLQGQSLDIKEFYLKFNNEYLNSWQRNDYDMEIRLVALLGYSLSPVNDLEIGIDYRLDSFISDNSRNRIWLSINYFHLVGDEY